MIVDHARLARSARHLKLLAMLGFSLVLAGIIFGSWLLLAGSERGGALVFSVETGGLEPVPAVIVLLVAGSLTLLALMQIIAMVRSVEAGAPFRTGARLRRFALYLFLATLAATLLPPLIQLGLTLAGSPRRVSLSLDGEQLFTLFVTGLLFFVARLLEAAQSVAEDHEQIV